jgi:hypothetical protein
MHKTQPLTLMLHLGVMVQMFPAKVEMRHKQGGSVLMILEQ